MAASPVVQLVSLCTGIGAVPSRIAEVAPFLRDLAATQHAHQVLYPNEEMTWEYAARELLVCVTKVGGAANFDERTAIFVRACLSLDGALSSYTQRVDNLANNPKFSYPTSRNTLDKMRNEAMGMLASSLLQLQSYPCDRGKAKSAARIALNCIEFIKEESLGLSDDETINDFYDEVRRKLPVAASYLERTYPQLSLSRRLIKMITLVVDGPYRQIYEELKPRGAWLIIDPDKILQDYQSLPSNYVFLTPTTERTQHLIDHILFDMERRNGWETLLQPFEPGISRNVLNDDEITRLHAYFERSIDDLGYPD